MDKIRLVCFDVDGTLVDGTSWLILTESLGCSPQKHLDLFLRAKKGEITFVEGERLLTKMYQDSGRATRSFIKKLFSWIKPRPKAKNLIFYLKKKGYPVYLISGAIDIFVKEITKKVRADGFYANSSLDFEEKGRLQKIHYRELQGELKVDQLKELIKKLGIKMDEVAFIGDSENDLEVFEATGHGIAVHSSCEELKKIAWKVVDSLEEIKKIL